MIRGNLEGVKKIYIEELENLYEVECDKNLLVSSEILDIICRISSKINREISLYINRRGRIIDIGIGDSFTVSLEAMSEKRNENTLSGIRCIHTHPSGEAYLSSVDVTALINMKFDCMAAVNIKDEKPYEFSFGYLKIEDGKINDEVLIEGVYPVSKIRNVDFMDMIQSLEKNIYDKIHVVGENKRERSILVGMASSDLYTPEESLNELEELADTAGSEVVYKVIQNRGKIDTAYYIGSGKAREIALLRQSLMADTVIFDDELSGAQVRNLEEIIGCKVIDRTTLILDIFAQRAVSREGKIQVELAQLKYRLPRLIGLGGVLSRTGGGIGTRGPGEKKLEIDRRHIKNRIYDLEKELEDIKKNRNLQRERRKSNEIPVVSFAGYTNAGKSTLRNKLCEISGIDKEKVLEADMLFATLDTTTRLVKLPSGKDVLLSDTVGFIRKLPHELIEAFKSTLEEVIYSDVIVHVVDASNKNAQAQIETVNSVLKEIGAGDKKIILAFNKVDIADDENISVLRSKYSDGVEISALKEINLDVLMQKIENEVYKEFIEAKLFIPYSDTKIISYLHDNKCVEKEEYKEDGIYVDIRTTKDILGRVKDYEIEIH
ncbi:GTP-binding protein HflX [Caloramator quimbayensis]|uniref:GTPase HflX n=1 Tax=Caloramator quimbayensis TaxID=1147123 RepID=A0A1T4WQD7_9CLOT|nr:GTPase HflX [Caloramator quimbayensis]SKA79574.1 GTP-binding protein HflX [Caloramator quimbayensis]